MQYHTIKTAKLYKLAPDVYRDHPEFDHLIFDPFHNIHELIGHREAVAWRMLEHNKSISEIVSSLTIESGKYEEEYVRNLINSWGSKGLVYSKEKPQFPHPKWWKQLIWREIAVVSFPSVYKNIYASWGRRFFTQAGLAAVLTALIVGAVTIFIQLLGGNSAALEVVGPRNGLLILGIIWGSLALHELGHALAMQFVGAPLMKAGIALFLGLPVLFVDTTTVWAKRRWKRILVSVSGFTVNALLASVAGFFALIVQNSLFDAWMWEIISINLLMFAISLIPFVKMDGYYVLIDFIGLPELDRVAYAELKEFVRHPHQVHQRRNQLLLFYAILSVITSLALAAYAGYYWLSLIDRII